MDEQFGFQPQHTTSLKITRIVEKANRNFNINYTMSILALDLEKTFEHGMAQLTNA